MACPAIARMIWAKTITMLLKVYFEYWLAVLDVMLLLNLQPILLQLGMPSNLDLNIAFSVFQRPYREAV